MPAPTRLSTEPRREIVWSPNNIFLRVKPVKTKMLFATLPLVLALVLGVFFQRSHSLSVQKLQAQIATLWAQRDALADENRKALQKVEELQLAMAKSEQALVEAKARPAVGSTNAADQENSILTTVHALADKVGAIIEYFEKIPGALTPELGLLSESEWVELAQKHANLSTREAVLSALASIRIEAKSRFLDDCWQAVMAFQQDNQGKMPTQFSQLSRYFSKAVGDDIFNRYEILDSDQLAEMVRRNGLNQGTAKGRATDPDYLPNTGFCVREKAVQSAGWEGAPAQFCLSKDGTKIQISPGGHKEDGSLSMPR